MSALFMELFQLQRRPSYIKGEGQTFMLEATLLQVGGVPHGDYSKVIFNVSAITKYLVWGKNCLFVSQLKRSA
jgi:hypothetical protein